MTLRSIRGKVGATIASGLVLILIIFFLIAVSKPSEFGAELIHNRTFPSLSYGIQAFLWWDDTSRPIDLERIRQMRFGYVKQIFNWNDVQPFATSPRDWTHADTVVDEIEYRQLKLIVRISGAPAWATIKGTLTPTDAPFNLTAFASYCGELAARYKGRIAGYEVWNEPNLAREWAEHTPNAAGYVKLLAACHDAIKLADPGAVIISAGLSPTGNDDDTAIPDDKFLQEMYTAGAAKYYDVLGLNAPGYKSPPTLPPDDPSLDHQRWQTFRHVEDMRRLMVQNGEGSKQVALLEVGWTIDPRDTVIDPATGKTIPNTYRWFAVDGDTQSKYLVGAYQYAAEHWRPWVGLMTTIYMPDPAWTRDREEYWWAIAEPSYAPKLRSAFFDLANMPRAIDDLSIPALDPGKPQYTPLPPRTPKSTSQSK